MAQAVRRCRCSLIIASPTGSSEAGDTMHVSHKFKRVRLNLARSKEFPEGSAAHGYEFVAPLDVHGYIDPKLWKEQRDHCRVRRFWNGEDEQIGWLVHKPGGAEHARGSSITTPPEAMMMSRGIDLAVMHSCPANTSQSIMRVICTPSGSSP